VYARLADRNLVVHDLCADQQAEFGLGGGGFWPRRLFFST